MGAQCLGSPLPSLDLREMRWLQVSMVGSASGGWRVAERNKGGRMEASGKRQAGLSAQGSLGEAGRGGSGGCCLCAPPSVCLFLFWFVGLSACLFSKEREKEGTELHG